MASTFTELKKGAQGTNVLSLQSALKNAGYQLTPNGTFDDLTESALRQYQTDNNLTVDGIAGDQTLGRLYNIGSAAGDAYSPSAGVVEAQKYLEAVRNNQPGEYQSKYTNQLDGILDQLTGRGPFQYDPSNDPLYNIYKDRYIMNGQRAMQDTMGQAAGLTGGYGNSYAQSVGQQTYNQYMEGLNDVVPQLAQMAYQRYGDEGDRLAQNYELLAAADDRAYGRNQDDYTRWMQQQQLAQQQYENEYARDYGAYQDALANQMARDKLAEEQRQYDQTYGLQRDQFAESQRQYDQNYGLQRDQFAADQDQYNRNLQLQYDQLALQREKEQNAIDSENREYAYKTAMSILQTGGTPSAALLEAAGLSAEDAALLAAYYTPKKSSGNYNPEPKKEKDEDKQNVNNIRNSFYAKEVKKNLGGSTVLTPRQYAEVDPFQQAILGMDNPIISLRAAEKNYTNYANEALQKGYNNGTISATEAYQIGKKIQNGTMLTEKDRKVLGLTK